MVTIWKYIFSLNEHQSLDLPEGAVILSATVQREKIVLYVIIDSHNPLEIRKFRIINTGQHIREKFNTKMKFIGTCQLMEGALVKHVFEVLPDIS